MISAVGSVVVAGREGKAEGKQCKKQWLPQLSTWQAAQLICGLWFLNQRKPRTMGDSAEEKPIKLEMLAVISRNDKGHGFSLESDRRKQLPIEGSDGHGNVQWLHLNADKEHKVTVTQILFSTGI